MGCTSSRLEEVDITELCSSNPDVLFEENIEKFEVKDSLRSRNVACWRAKGIKDENLKGVICIAHGVLEHCLAYWQLAIYLATKEYVVYGLDQVAHGKNSMKDIRNKCIVHDHKVLRDDFIAFFNTTRSKFSKLPAFIFAHSMGTLVTLAGYDGFRNLDGLTLSGLAIEPGPGGASPFGCECLYPVTKWNIAKSLSRCLASIDSRGIAAPIKGTDLIFDQAEIEERKKDPRRGPAYVSNATARSLLVLLDEAISNIEKINVPLCLIHGADDRVCYPSGSQLCFDKSSSMEKSIHIMDDFKHELVQESATRNRSVLEIILSFYDKTVEKNQFNI